MDSINFIPNEQKKFDKVSSQKLNSNMVTLYILIFLTVLYAGVVFGIYSIFIVQEKSKLEQELVQLNSLNITYPKSSDLGQLIFNLNDILSKAYNPFNVMVAIEREYIPNSRVNRLVYDKTQKVINLSMVVPDTNSVARQVKLFNDLSIVAKADPISTTTLPNRGGVTVDVLIQLK